jgi:indoleamine 2,3-dioxygenase
MPANDNYEAMWGKSKPKDYISFRTFIFGITSQSMFPHGVVYEGVSDEPLSFRGESGANDSMVSISDIRKSRFNSNILKIPLCDNLLQIAMPSTPLTAILQDFRSYRPGNHREFLEYVKDTSAALSLRSYAMQEPSSRALYLLALNQVRDFRWRHWCFTREYILKKTSHPVATGGSPIVTWLPNQLMAVMDAMADVWESAENKKNLGKECETVMELLFVQRDTLRKEVEKYCAERGVDT